MSCTVTHVRKESGSPALAAQTHKNDDPVHIRNNRQAMFSTASIRSRAALLLLPLLLLAVPAEATQPLPWQLGMQPAATPVKEFIGSFHNMLLVIITLITIFVLALLLYTIVRFRASANPTPSKTTHHTMLEVAWTLVPVLILVVIAVPSFRLIYFADKAPNADFTLKVTGHQWYWSYEYPDHGEFQFDSYMVADADLKPGQTRLLEVDNRTVVPVGATVRVVIAGADVIHSWFVPALGVQKYAMPGRLNEIWFRIDKPGVYYGQCNQICGVNHWFMPIEVRAVPREQFNAWAEQAKTRFAQGLAPTHPSQIAAAEPTAPATLSLAEARR
jgi:cytochrome c oxidase subunit 2